MQQMRGPAYWLAPPISLLSQSLLLLFMSEHTCVHILASHLCPARRGDKKNTRHSSAVTTSVETGAGRGRTLTISFVCFCVVSILYNKNVLLCYCVKRKCRPRRTKDMTPGFEFLPSLYLKYDPEQITNSWNLYCKGERMLLVVITIKKVSVLIVIILCQSLSYTLHRYFVICFIRT